MAKWLGAKYNQEVHFSSSVKCKKGPQALTCNAKMQGLPPTEELQRYGKRVAVEATALAGLPSRSLLLIDCLFVYSLHGGCQEAVRCRDTLSIDTKNPSQSLALNIKCHFRSNIWKIRVGYLQEST